jgi:hypothetical protein
MEIDRQVVAPMRVALTRPEPLARPTLSATIRRQLDRVWGEVRAGRLPPHGRSVCLYDGPPPQVASGVQVEAAFVDLPEVRCAELPGGPVLRAVHAGPYERMHETYRALEQRAAELGCRFVGVSWEIYGHWSDDPAELKTEIYQLLAP